MAKSGSGNQLCACVESVKMYEICETKECICKFFALIYTVVVIKLHIFMHLDLGQQAGNSSINIFAYAVVNCAE